MAIRVLLWDFGDTMVDERWMLAPMVGVPAWQEAYTRVLRQGDFADRRNLGAISTQDVAANVGKVLGILPALVRSHMEECSRKVVFFQRVLELTNQCKLPQAIVTVNPDIFTEIVVPTFQLDRRFSTIITSWECRNSRKADLCDVARARLDRSLRRDECLLIDNKLENVSAWCDRGGVSFHFHSEDDMSSIRERLRH